MATDPEELNLDFDWEAFHKEAEQLRRKKQRQALKKEVSDAVSRFLKALYGSWHGTVLVISSVVYFIHLAQLPAGQEESTGWFMSVWLGLLLNALILLRLSKRVSGPPVLRYLKIMGPFLVLVGLGFALSPNGDISFLLGGTYILIVLVVLVGAPIIRRHRAIIGLDLSRLGRGATRILSAGRFSLLVGWQLLLRVLGIALVAGAVFVMIQFQMWVTERYGGVIGALWCPVLAVVGAFVWYLVRVSRQLDKQMQSIKDSPEMWYGKGVDCCEKGEYQRAIECFKEALQRNPEYAEAWYSLGLTHSDCGRYAQALDCYDRAIELSPFHPNAWNNKGFVLYKLRKHDEAIECYETAAEQGSVEARNNLLKLKGEHP